MLRYACCLFVLAHLATPLPSSAQLARSSKILSAKTVYFEQEDRVPDYNRQSPVRYAYLTVIDSKSGQKLWSDSPLWGGRLTGQNSAGKRLIEKLQKQVGKQFSPLGSAVNMEKQGESL
jgi:hypothetical protein